MNDDLASRLAAAAPLAGVRPQTTEAVAEHSRERHLQPGEALLEQGEGPANVYVVVDGRLRAVVDHGADSPQDLGTLEAGAVLGEIAVLAGGRREATVVAETAATVVEISATGFELLLEQEPDVAGRLAALATARLREARLARQVAGLFPDVDEAGRDAILGSVEWVSVRAGEQLVARGDPADAAYIVVTGRVRAVGDGGPRDALADFGPGALVGEMALVEGGTRAATLVAIRDTDCARLRRDELLDALRGHPETLLRLARTALRRATGTSEPRGGERRSVVLVAVHPSVDLAAFGTTLLAELHREGSARLVTSADADDALGDHGLARADPDGPARVRLVQWLQEQEQRYDTLLLQTQAGLEEWNDAVLRHADHLVLVADASADPAPTAVEARVRDALRERSATRDSLVLLRESLVLLHPDEASEAPRGTARWLASRTVDACYHVRQAHAPDHARVARIIAERPIGLVLSGGGARGFAHLGVARALEEAGVPVDIVAGSSMGAVMAVFLALDLGPEERVARAKAALRRILDWTLPVAGLVKGGRMAELADHEVGGRDIEDLWLPCLAVTTNLTRSEASVHRRGSIAKALRASTALPGIVPPVVYGDELHVDGSVLDNLPVEKMRRVNPRGPVVAVDVSMSSGPRAPEDFGLSVSGWGLLARRLLPGSQPPPAPGIATTLVQSVMAGAAQERDRMVDKGLADLHLDLELPRCGLLELDAADRIIAAGYESALGRIRDWAPTLGAER